MGLLSLFKQKQESPDDANNGDSGEFHSRAEMESKPKRASKKAANEAGRNSNNARNDKVDPQLPEKKRARRRLIGAVALVLAAVIGLPMILDAEQKPVSENIAIIIPSKDKVPELSKPNPKDIPAEVVEPISPNSPEPKIDVKASAPIKPDVKQEIVADTQSEAKKNSKKDAVKEAPSTPKTENKSSDVKADAKKEPKADAKVDPKSDPKSDPKQSKPAADIKSTPNKEEAARALAILEAKSETSASKKIEGGFVVQVAALSTPEKVHALQGKLKTAGVTYFTQKVVTQSGDIIRIRVGPFSSKTEAEKMRLKLSKSDLPGTLIPQ